MFADDGRLRGGGGFSLETKRPFQRETGHLLCGQPWGALKAIARRRHAPPVPVARAARRDARRLRAARRSGFGRRRAGAHRRDRSRDRAPLRRRERLALHAHQPVRQGVDDAIGGQRRDDVPGGHARLAGVVARRAVLRVERSAVLRARGRGHTQHNCRAERGSKCGRSHACFFSSALSPAAAAGAAGASARRPGRSAHVRHAR